MKVSSALYPSCSIDLMRVAKERARWYRVMMTCIAWRVCVCVCVCECVRAWMSESVHVCVGVCVCACLYEIETWESLSV